MTRHAPNIIGTVAQNLSWCLLFTTQAWRHSYVLANCQYLMGEMPKIREDDSVVNPNPYNGVKRMLWLVRVALKRPYTFVVLA